MRHKRLITIDPGTKCTGVAVWHGGELQAAFPYKPVGDAGLAARNLVLELEIVRDVHRLHPLDTFARDILTARSKRSPFSAVIERPGQYEKKVSPESLFILALLAGAYAGSLAANGAEEARFILASDWKGTVPKPKRAADSYIITRRCARLLSERELARVEASKTNASESWDVWDAIGIGLVMLKRAGRGVS